ncbi:MAG: hypothetical protein KDC06_10095, partial [Chitinophagaceae bacterium]|nr:hypothetical protein [Chitinophagaceae bacterium]
ASDPTITAFCTYLNIPVSVIGIMNAQYPVFEIELYFANQKIVICHSGDEIRYYAPSTEGKWLKENEHLRQAGILKEYMVPVLDKAKGIVQGKIKEDNFLQAAALNKRMLSILKNHSN